MYSLVNETKFIITILLRLCLRRTITLVYSYKGGNFVKHYFFRLYSSVCTLKLVKYSVLHTYGDIWSIHISIYMDIWRPIKFVIKTFLLPNALIVISIFFTHGGEKSFTFHIFAFNISKTLGNLDTKIFLPCSFWIGLESSVLLYDLLVSLHPLHFCYIHINLYAHKTLYIFAILCISFILGFSFWQLTF